MSNGTREMMDVFLVFLLTLVLQAVPLEALDAQCMGSRCSCEYALTHLVFLDTQGQSCCCDLLGCQTCTSVSHPLILFGQQFQVLKEAQLNI